MTKNKFNVGIEACSDVTKGVMNLFFDNKLELYIKTNDVTLEKIKDRIIEGCWTDEEGMKTQGNTISFTGGEYGEDFEITLNSDEIVIEGDSSWEVVQLWEELKRVAL